MLRELKTFLAVARHGTFAAAGAQIGLTQSAVSAQIQRLEEELGAPLFQRTGRSARLNDAGTEAVVLARQIVELFGEMGNRVTSQALRGGLKLGSVQTAQVGLLPAALKLLHGQHPQVSVRLMQGSSLFLMGQVDSGELDAALMVLSPFSLPSELVWQPLLREPFVLAVPAAETGDDWQQLLGRYPVIRYDRGSFGGRVVDQFLRQHKPKTEATLDMEDVDAMVKMVSSGLGIALVPATRPDFTPPDVRTVSLGEQTFHREIGMVFQGTPERGGLVGALRECLVESARAMPTRHPRL
ncbi:MULTISPECIES: LysR family transcriptional regulator [Ramlibacter]|uniref:LysR family transcriptional regulator n=1 Tax=Ramlibacter pinisoli TaxID=2682844 RepID=A0A6N8IRG1_9BURK|nr:MULTISPECIES: LysR family transcriptional regulator [Ramlibacter]MBA2964458.1 LysR family transcriptional regulator [Ramlibacter sp. CGMCC 1.13660]MVQ29424.1 LysR family transcriptional regulator [Ramlibacter pinisoli]